MTEKAPPRFSIVTVVRNDLPGLERTRASLAEQAFRGFEWIVIDGASTDATRPAVQALLTAGTARGVSEPDGGIYDAMNKGLRLALGEHLLFLNAGDRLLAPDSLARATRAMTARGDPDIAFFGSLMAFGGRMVTRHVKPPSYVWHGQPGLHQATFVRRTLHLAYPFDPRFRVCGDYDALARMASASARMESIAATIGVNVFEAGAMSANKRLLIREAAAIQRTVLALPVWKVAFSAARRALHSILFKLLTPAPTRGVSR
jgi:putative colanic acid biosynthesis glycosyltransferase